MLHNRTIVMAIALFVIIIIGMFGFAFLKKSELKQTQEPVVLEPSDDPVVDDRYANIERINAKHFFIDGEHTLAGEITLPTPCDLLSWDVMVAESFPEQVTANFEIINNSEACAQVVTNQRFKVSFSASEAASIGATLNGRPVELNLIPAAEGETPDQFELFIKG